jgi:hypothetical protein
VKRDSEDKEECAKPNEYSYITDKGETVVKKISEKDADKVLGWVEKGEYEKLEG